MILAVFIQFYPSKWGSIFLPVTSHLRSIRLFEDVLKRSWRRVLSSSSRLPQDVLIQRNLLQISHSSLDVFKTPLRTLDQDKDVHLGHTSSRLLRYVLHFRTFSRRFIVKLGLISHLVLMDLLLTLMVRILRLFHIPLENWNMLNVHKSCKRSFWILCPGELQFKKYKRMFLRNGRIITQRCLVKENVNEMKVS